MTYDSLVFGPHQKKRPSNHWEYHDSTFSHAMLNSDVSICINMSQLGKKKTTNLMYVFLFVVNKAQNRCLLCQVVTRLVHQPTSLLKNKRLWPQTYGTKQVETGVNSIQCQWGLSNQQCSMILLQGNITHQKASSTFSAFHSYT